MANKVAYNNIQYDILDAIQMGSREYLIMLNPHNFCDIRYIEKAITDGSERYFLPPTDFSLEKNGKDLKRLQINIIMNKLVEILKSEVAKENLNTVVAINAKISQIKSFCFTDLTLKSFVEDTRNLNEETFDKITTYLTKYLEHNLVTKGVQKNKEELGLNRAIKTSEGLNYEWLYSLSSTELKEIASDKNRTSEELIYILDALDKRLKTEQSIENYTADNGYSKTYGKEHKAAFIDVLLLSLITGSFGILLLLSIFN